MKIGDVVTYKGLYGGWIGVIVSWGEARHVGEIPIGCTLCGVRWYDGSVTDELIEMLEVVSEAG